MRTLHCAAAALLLITLSLAGPNFAVDGEGLKEGIRTSDGATLRSDYGGIAGAFIKPPAAAPAFAEPPEEQRDREEGGAAGERRGSRPFSHYSLLHDEPALLSAAIRRAHLNVYRL